MTLEQFAQRIAAAAGMQELTFCRKIGMGELDAARQSFRVLDEVYNSVFEVERDLITLPLKMIGKSPDGL